MGAGLVWGLGWIGARARWALLLGCLVAMAVPQIGAFLRPVFPALVATVFMLAMLRVDLGATARRAATPRRLRMTLPLSFALIVLTPLVYLAGARLFGASDEVAASLVYLGLSPPLASSAALCLMLGLDAVLALELTVITSFLTPVIGPPLARLMLGADVPIDALEMSLRLAAMIGAGALAAHFLRRVIGPERIARERAAFDGAAALAMLVFVFPLFEGVAATARAYPVLAILLLTIACALNFGPQIVATLMLRRPLGADQAGAAGLAFGNRSIALYFAALPPEPVFALFVALYQLPMYATPLVMGRFYARNRDP